MQGHIHTRADWVQLRPERIIQNQQTFFVTIESFKMTPGPFEEFILISTNHGGQMILISGTTEPHIKVTWEETTMMTDMLGKFEIWASPQEEDAISLKFKDLAGNMTIKTLKLSQI